MSTAPMLDFDGAASRREARRLAAARDSAKGRPYTADPNAVDARKWIDANPDAFDALVTTCRQLLAKHGRVSVKKAVEDLRWNPAVAVDRLGSEFRVPNAYTAEIACDIARRHPDIAPYLTSKRGRRAGEQASAWEGGGA